MERAVVLAAILSAAGGSVDYCGARMCARSNAHTFCQYRPGPGPRCVAYTEDRLSSEEKARVLARLNRRRSEAAQGLLRQLPPASNMLKLRWVEELSREAQLWADQCEPPGSPEEHDACRDLYSISVGQCVASVVGEAPGLRAESMVDTWYLQGLYYKGNITYTMNTKRYDMDFAQMLWAHTYLVGCARSRFMSEVNGRMRTVTRLVCNLAPRGPGGVLWLPGAPAAACPPRARPAADHAALCDYLDDMGDVYDVSNEMTQQEQTVLNAVLQLERNQSLDHQGSLDEIYLTNMAIATLSRPAFTQSYIDSIQKRDIVEPIYREDEETIVAGTKVNVIDDVIAKLVREKTTTTKEPEVITKVNIIGRPKSYRIDELDESDDKNLYYAKTRPVGTTTVTELDAYVEYEFQDIPEKHEAEENFTENEVKSLSPTIALNPTVTENATEMESLTTQLTSNPAIENLTLEANVTNDALRKLLELSKKTEEFPSDPETARELQEALEQLEMTLADERPVKVRREVKRRPPAQYQQYPPNMVSQHHRALDPLPEELMRNSSMAKPPMLDMVFKYLPFMRKYEKAVTGTSAAGSTALDSWLLCVKISVFCTFNL